VRVGANFPYGYGVAKNWLRIAKCSGVPVGKTIDVTIKFSVWSREDKRGITCYLKK